MLLVESKRPHTLSEIVGQDDAIRRLNYYAENHSTEKIPHFVLSGPPGCGKTSAIHAWANKVYGKEKYRATKLINTSGDRSVASIIHKVHNACHYYYEIREAGGRGLIVCDEADSLTSEAQEVMAYCINRYQHRWIFVLIMNHPSKINKRLMDLCEHIPFKSLQNLHTILNGFREEFALTDDDIDRLIREYNGDLRKILNAIQGSKFGTSHFIPEWKADPGIMTVTRFFNRIKDECDSDGTVESKKLAFEIAIGLHRPGSLNPYRYAINELL